MTDAVQFPVKPLRTSIVQWHTAEDDRPARGEEVLAQHVNGDHYLMFWRDDADCWDDSFHGFIGKSEIVAWARLPVYDGD